MVADVRRGRGLGAVLRCRRCLCVVGVVGDVGYEHLQAPSGGVGEGQLRSGVGVLGRAIMRVPSGQGDRSARSISDLGVVAQLCAVGAERRLPALGGDFEDGLGDVDAEGVPDQNRTPRSRHATRNARVHPAVSALRSLLCRGGPRGSAPARRRGPRCGQRRCWSRRCRAAADPRGTRRSRRDRPSADGAPSALVGPRGALLVRVRVHQRGVDVDHIEDRRPRPTPAAGPRRAPL